MACGAGYERPGMAGMAYMRGFISQLLGSHYFLSASTLKDFMKVILFFELFFLYKKRHSVKYAYTRAKEIAFQGLPF